MSAERERLEKVYAGFGDDELLKLDKDQESLTQDAGAALAAVIAARGLATVGHAGAASGPEAGIPGILPGMETMERSMDLAGSDDDPETAGLVELISFMDGHELGKAVQFLKDAEILFKLQAAREDALRGAPPSFHIMVEEQDMQDGQRLLRETMGLFPLPEVSEEDAELEDGAMQELGSFETMADAEQAMSILAAKGVESKVIEPTDPNDWFVVQVKVVEFARALQVLVDGLRMME